MSSAYRDPVVPPPQQRPLAAALLCAAAGFVVWAALWVAAGSSVDGRFVVREAWDTGAYWLFGLPIIAVAVAIAGYLSPRRVWRWPLYAVAGQAIAMALVHPPGTDAGLVPFAVVFVGVPLVLVMTIPALIAGVAARGRWSSDLIR